MYARAPQPRFGNGTGKAARGNGSGPQNQVGTGDRSERIRTYNYPQGRVSEHRIGLTLHRLDAVLNGDLDEILDALITAQQSKLLQQVK